MNMAKFKLHHALIELVQLREAGKSAYAEFKCEFCNAKCTIPRVGEGKSSFKCCKCEETNYLDGYEVKTY